MNKITEQQFFEFFNAAVHHNGTLPDDQEGVVLLTKEQIQKAASWLYDEMKGA